MFAQVPGADRVIDSASQHSWEAAAVALVLAVMLAGIAWMMRALWNVNNRLADRVTALEGTIHDKLISIVEGTTAALTANTSMMERTANSIDKLEAAVEHLLRTHEALMARIEASPCLMTTVLSVETQERLQLARETAKAAAREATGEKNDKS